MIIPDITLYNGVKVPQIGLGVFLMEEEEEAKWAIQRAIKTGYRHFDTASIYGNEEFLAKALLKSEMNRNEFFLTSKVWNNRQGYSQTKEAFQESIDKLQTDYLDLYLIHWFGVDVKGTWRAMEELYEEGKIRAIGVSNFTIDHLESMKEFARIMPMINQVETHPYFPQNELRDYMQKEEIAHQAWGPLSQGKSDLLMHPLLYEIGKKYGKTPAQITLKWHTERNTIVIPKSVHSRRIAENFDLFDFTLTEEDMKAIEEMNMEARFGRDPLDWEFVERTSRE
ncbi:aldo/keto reductase [Jeotgalibaca sp. MA1X17-3]|uniref:aldo/keto reductase n=1 Tax=Jeotgalibaca sp. MA1X17-3 TaxID=2908211 RepID=UPI001F361C91|nr:aldo/keto reductase [Jeotgalibaca sp. MA1X17-3]UJF15199.1 aldo/keto reductase [Jeotgalibaca sp. MA1X17-3]